MNDQTVSKAPTHLWVVGIVSLLWNGFGCFDYLMTVTHNETWLAEIPADAKAIIDAFPTWITALWAIGVWGALLGAVLLLMRNRQATTAFLVSLVAVLASYAYQATTSLPALMGGAAYWVMPAIIIVAAVGQWLYASKAAAAGVLR